MLRSVFQRLPFEDTCIGRMRVELGFQARAQVIHEFLLAVVTISSDHIAAHVEAKHRLEPQERDDRL